MSLLEKIIPESKRLSEKEFSAKFPGPFLLQTRFQQRPTDFDVSFDTAAGSVQNKPTKETTIKPLPVGDSQRLSSISAISTLEDLLRYYVLYSVEKSQRNIFLQGITIGRTNNNDIVIVEATVSKFHAWIQRPGLFGRRYVLFDANSHYGTLVNYAKVGPEGAELPPGAKVRFGNAALTFLMGEGLYQWVRALPL